MNRHARFGRLNRQTLADRGIGAFAALALACCMTGVEAAPSITPPSTQASPGATLPIDIAPGDSRANLLEEQLISASWTENGGKTSKTRALSPSGDTIEYQVPEDAQHCTSLPDEVSVAWRVCGDACTEGNPVASSFSVTVIDPLTIGQTTATIGGAPGSTQTIDLDIHGGTAPYQAAASARGATVSLSGTRLSYSIPAGATSSYQDRVTISGGRAGDACGGNSATLSIDVTLSATPLAIAPESINLGSFQPGQTVTTRFTVSGGLPGYSASIIDGPSGASVTAPTSDGGSGTFSYAIPADAESGSTRVTIQVSDSGTGTAQQRVSTTLVFSIEASIGPALSANPSDIAFSAISQGSPSDVSKTFQVSGGTAPYTLSVAGISGDIVGRVEPARLESAGTATYVVRIPANAQSDVAFANRIQITDATGGTTSVTVEANVTATNRLSTLPGLNPNQRSVAEAIEIICPRLASRANRTADEEDLFTQCSAMLSNPTAAGIPNTLEQITNQKANAAKTAGIKTGNQQLTNITSRLAAIRSGSVGLDLSALSLNSGSQTLSASQLAQLASTQLTGGGASADTFGRWGFFINGTVDFGNRDTTRNETGYDFNTTGITGGADYRFSDTLVAGGAIGYAQHGIDFDANDGGLDTETWHLSAYATTNLSERVYLDAIVEYGWNDYRSQRNIGYQIDSDLVSVNRRAEADYSGSQLGASLGAGYDIDDGPLAYGVYGRVAYLSVTVDDYREQNAGGLNLTMASFETSSVTSVLGARVSRVFNTARAVLIPQARLEWEHEYDNDASRLTAAFAADPTSTRFTIYTDDPDRDYFRLGLGLSAILPHGLTTFVNYNTMLDKKDWMDHRIDAGVRLEFY